MASVCTAFGGRRVIAATLVAASLLGFGGRAEASPASWVKQALANTLGHDGRTPAAPPVARYVIDEGGVFILDRSSRRPLLKFDDSPEVWVLSPSRGPRGDIIYKNDLGEPLLRATKLGGMTVFTPRRPEGSAAALIGPSTPLRLSTIGPVALLRDLAQASFRSSRAAQHLIEFEAPDTSAANDGLIADAAIVAMEAVVTLSSRPGGKAALARIGKIALIGGDKPAAKLRGGVLTITVVPPQGLGGRPSSMRILQAAMVR